MKIGRHNYESWFLDYLDGKLDAGQEETLLSFLDFNPDLREEFEGLERIRLEGKNLTYDLKATLRKPLAQPDRQDMLDHFEDYCISSIEQQLSPQEETMLQGILEDEPAKRNIYRLYRSTIIKAEEGIQYPGKSRLKKRYIDIPRVRLAVSSIAAAVLLGLAITLLFRKPAEPNLITHAPDPSSVLEEPESLEKGVTEKTLENPVIGEAHPDIIEDKEGMERTARGKAETEPDPIPQKGDLKDFVTGVQDEIQSPVPGPTLTGREILILARLESIEAGPLENPGRMNNLSLSHRQGFSDFDDYLPLDEYVMERINRRRSTNAGERKISFWKLADAGIQEINEASQEEYSLERETDDYGHVRRLTFESPFFGISTPTRNSDLPR